MIAELQARIAELQDQLRDELAATMRVERVALTTFAHRYRPWLEAVRQGSTVLLTLEGEPFARVADVPRYLIPDTPRIVVDQLHRKTRASIMDRLAAGGPVILSRYGHPVALLVPVNP